MFLAGTTSLSCLAIQGKFGKIWTNEEFWWYTGIIGGFTLVIATGLFLTTGSGLEHAFRQSVFHVVSILTTTGFATADYLLWAPWLGVLIFILMFFGGSAGSTGGGPKIMRIMIMLKNSTQELKRMIHPNALIPVRLNRTTVEEGIVTNVLAFIALYVIIAIISMMLMSFRGMILIPRSVL
jgi:trk system potassium uptake protein TrkH